MDDLYNVLMLTISREVLLQSSLGIFSPNERPTEEEVYMPAGLTACRGHQQPVRRLTLCLFQV